MLRILLNSNIVNQEFFPDIFRKKLMQIYCDSIEKDCHIKQIKFIGGKQLRIGKKTFVNRFCNFFYTLRIHVVTSIWEMRLRLVLM